MAFTISGTGGLTFPDATTMTTGSQAVKAWVNFNGTTAAIRSSYNVSSITRTAAGFYTINFSSSFADTNYVSALGGGATSSNSDTLTQESYSGNYVKTTSSYAICTVNMTWAASDRLNVYAVFFR